MELMCWNNWEIDFVVDFYNKFKRKYNRNLLKYFKICFSEGYYLVKVLVVFKVF